MTPLLRPLATAALCASALCAASGAARAQQLGECRLGFGGAHKLGLWTTVRVEVTGLTGDDAALELHASAPDPDGAAMVVVTPVEAPLGGADRAVLVEAPVRVGRVAGAIGLTLVRGGRVLDRKTLAPPGEGRVAPDAGPRVVATDRLWVEFAGGDGVLRAAASAGPAPDEVASAGVQIVVARVERFGEPDSGAAPTSWLGYEGVDLLWITPRGARGLRGADDPRVAAVRAWVESGGRLVLTTGAEGASLVGPGAPFEGFVPGDFDDVGRMAGTEPVERYAESDAPLRVGAEGLAITRLRDARGVVEANAGPGGAPLVSHAPLGLGEVTFVAFDPQGEGMAGWQGLPRVLQRITKQRVETSRAERGGNSLVSRGYDDLAGALHQRLGAAFVGVSAWPVMAVAALGVALAVLIGPGDYWLGRRIGRSEVTWVLFPLVLVTFSVGAQLLSARARGGQIRVNLAEVVDVDAASGIERGALFAQAYAPRAGRLDVGIHASGEGARSHTAWFGLPGAGLGGMQSRGDAAATSADYVCDPASAALRGVPIDQGSTKALTARWTRRSAGPGVESDLRPGGSGLVEGTLVNSTGVKLLSPKLLCGGWGWRLPDLDPGEVVTIDAGLAPAKIKTVLLREYAAGVERGSVGELDLGTLPADALLTLMLFDRELDASGLVGAPASAQPMLDLSSALEGGSAVLLARVASPSGLLVVRGTQPEAPPDAVALFRRYVLPVSQDP